MIDITHKRATLRYAKAGARIQLSDPLAMEALVQKKVPKGDVLEAARTAGLYGVKQTSNTIPDCHPLPIEFAKVSYDINEAELSIDVEMEVKTVYKTGVEVEAMHGASVVALTCYDMLKPIDKGIEIQRIRLIEKTGGKSDFIERNKRVFKAAVIVCSDSVSKGVKEDKAGLIIKEKLESFKVEVPGYKVVPDEVDAIQAALRSASEEGMDLIIFTGGTGLSPRDVTPQAIRPLLDEDIPGIAEAVRSYGMDRTPLAMLSRSVSGSFGKSLVLAFPGSSKGASESVDAIFPSVLHVFKVFRGLRHD